MKTLLRTGRGRVVLAVVACLFVASVAALVVTKRKPHDLKGAIGIARSRSRFDSSPRAADSFLAIREILFNEARSCISKQGRASAPCSARGSGVALAQSAAVIAARCTQPGVYAARVGVLHYLEGIKALDLNPKAPPPPFPTLPVC